MNSGLNLSLHDYATLMITLSSAQSQNEMINILLCRQFNDRLSLYLPEDIHFAHKKIHNTLGAAVYNHFLNQ